MDYVIHKNLWWWGKSYHFVTTDGKAMVCLAVEDDRPDCGCIQSLMVHESIREQGKGTELVRLAEDYAEQLGLEQVYLCARKHTFLVDWYRRLGYKVYDDNPEYSKGKTVAMNKYFK